MEDFRIRPVTETDVDAVITAAGGRRAHADQDRREKPGADYVLAESLIEYKALDDEGLAKPERQAKLATIFRASNENRPVIVLDRQQLSARGQREYDRALEGPIKAAADKARTQLKQSKTEYPSVT